MSHILQDVRFALRGFRRTPGFAIATVLILGVGIGMAAATVTVYNAVLLRRIPVGAQDRVVLPRVYDRVGVAIDLMPADLAKLDRDATTMRGVAGVTHVGANDSPLTDGTRSVVLRWAGITGNFFDVLNTRSVIGRLIAPRDGVVGAEPTLVLSYGAWQRQFNGDSSVIGRRLVSPYYKQPFTVIGVAPPGLDYPGGIEAWVASGPIGGGMMNIVARLAAGASPAAAAAELYDFMRRDPVMSVYATSARPRAVTLPHAIVGDVQPALRMLAAAVGLLLLIVCVNTGNLLLARAATRTRELTVRRALGASAPDIIRQLVVESTLLAIGGGLLGVACAEGLLRTVITVAPSSLPRLDAITLGAAPLAWCAATTVLALVMFGVLPAIIVSKRDLATPLRFDARSGRESTAQRRLRQMLVASQVALALVVLTGGSLLARSFARLEGVRIGYEPEHLSFLSLGISFDKFDNSQQKVNALYDDVERQLRAVPGVVSVTPFLAAPYVAPDLFLSTIIAEPGPTAARADRVVLPISVGGTQHFRTMGIALLRGREFLPSEVAEGGPGVAILSAAAAQRLWPGEDAVGKRVRSAFDTTGTAWVTVVGVTDETRYRRLKEPQPMMYVPWRQFTWNGGVAVRTSRPLASIQHELERSIHAANPNVAGWQARSASDYLDDVLAQPRLSAALLSALGAVATLLAAIGLYASMSDTVRDQTREIGVRMALGATPERIRREVLRTAMRVTSLGAVVGLACTMAGAQLLRNLLFEISPSDPVSLAGAFILLVATAGVAAYLPVRRATRIDPVEALRSE